MLRLSVRSLLILLAIFSGLIVQSVQPTPTHSRASLPPTTPLTLITVTTATDDFAINNSCSLREAVYAAVHDVAVDACAAGTPNDSISLTAGTYTLTRTGAFEDGGLTGDLDITGTLQLTGATSATTIIDGNHTDRIFDIFSGSVTLNHLTLRNGTAETEGGAVQLRSGALTADQTRFEHNRAKSINYEITYGGAIYNPAGTLVLTHSVFAANSADSEYMGNSGYGAVVYSGDDGTTTIVDSVFQDTIHNYGSAVIFNSGSISVSKSMFTNNPTPIWNSNGGSALIEASQFLTNTAPAILNIGQLTINASEIAFTNGGKPCSYGGGIANQGQAEINRTLIHDNVTARGAGVFSSGTAHIRDSAIVGNRAPFMENGQNGCIGEGAGISAGSGTLEIENTTIADNWSQNNAGGIYNYAASITLTNTSIVSNYADLNDPMVGHEFPSPSYAGGIFSYKPLSITNTLIAFNGSWLAPLESDCYGGLVSTNSLILAPQANCTITATASLIGVEPLLGPLADHGGNTPTYNLLPGSPAIDAGVLNGCPDHDQRGTDRPQDGDGSGGAQCDIGAYEYVAGPNQQHSVYLPQLRK